MDFLHHAEGRLRDRCGVPRSRPGFYDSLSTNRAGLRYERSRADEASREHLPSRQHRLGERAGHVRADLDIDVWSVHRRRVNETVWLHAVHSRSGCRWPLPSIDPSYLSWQVDRPGQPFRFVELANDVNDHMPDYVVRRSHRASQQGAEAVNGSRILLLGLAYKKNTSDARESPSVRIAKLLCGLGADVEGRGLARRLRHAAIVARAADNTGQANC